MVWVSNGEGCYPIWWGDKPGEISGYEISGWRPGHVSGDVVGGCKIGGDETLFFFIIVKCRSFVAVIYFEWQLNLDLSFHLQYKRLVAIQHDKMFEKIDCIRSLWMQTEGIWKNIKDFIDVISQQFHINFASSIIHVWCRGWKARAIFIHSDVPPTIHSHRSDA